MLIRKFINAFHIYRTRGIVDLLHIAVHKLPKAHVDLTDAVDVSNEYINWLYYANPGMLHRGNLYCIDYAIRNMPENTPVIEIGSFSGLSTNVLSYFKKKYHITKPLITCDKWEFAGSENGGYVGDSASVTHAEYREFVKKNYMRNIRMFSRHDLPYTLEMFSDDFFSAWRQSKEANDVLDRPIRLGGSIGFAYIDGDHSYEYARRDFENSDEFLVEGGFIFFDDSADGSEWEVCKVVAEVERSGRYDLIIKNPNYLFRKKHSKKSDK